MKSFEHESLNRLNILRMPELLLQKSVCLKQKIYTTGDTSALSP